MAFIDQNGQYIRPPYNDYPVIGFGKGGGGGVRSIPGGSGGSGGSSGGYSGVYDSAIPGAGMYAKASALAALAYKNALARLTRQRTGTLRQYGYLGDINSESGVVDNVRVDPHNPYGFFQRMLGEHATAGGQATDDSISRGIGARGGLAGKLQSMLKQRFGGDSAQLGQGLTDTLSDYQEQQTHAKYEYDRSLYEAELAQLMLALQMRMFNPAGGGGSRAEDAANRQFNKSEFNFAKQSRDDWKRF